MAAVRQKALNQLIDEELEFQDGVRRGITVSAAEVNAGVREASRRYGGLRGFDNALRQTGASLPAARREIARTLTIKKTVARVVTAQCQVSRAEAASFFSANPDRFVEPEQLHIYAITIGVDPSSTAEQWSAAKARAEDVRRQLAAGAVFEDLARKYSTDPSKATGGDMGFVHRGSLSDRFEQIAKDLPHGQASDVVETLYGYHIVRVSEVRPPQPKTLAEVGATLQKDLTTTRCTETKDAWVARLRGAATIVLAE
jgi:peptidyl-prolyl cis-trans isomerase C